MGWKLRILALLFALFTFSLGAWIVGIPIIVLVFQPLFRRGRRPEHTERPERPVARRSHVELRNLLAGLFFVLAIIAAFVGGSFSPFVFGSLGLVTLSWGRMSGTSFVSSIKPIRESIVMRGRLPFVYFAVAELKLTTRDASKMLTSLNGYVIAVSGEKPSVYVVMKCLAMNPGQAETRFVEKLKVMMDLVVPLGAYPLPLDAVQAMAALRERERLKLKAENLLPSLMSVPLQVLSVKVEGGFVNSLAAYGRVSGEGASTLPAKQKISPVLFWEVVRELSGRLAWPNPDPHSTFLASLFASKGAALGERVIDAGGSGTSTVLVRSTGSAPVELSRAQLRSIVRVYDQG